MSHGVLQQLDNGHQVLVLSYQWALLGPHIAIAGSECGYKGHDAAWRSAWSIISGIRASGRKRTGVLVKESEQLFIFFVILLNLI